MLRSIKKLHFSVKPWHGGAGMAQWWEHSPPTNVARVQFRPSVTCRLSLLLVLVLAPRVFLRVLRFSSLHKNQHSKLQFDQNRGTAWKPAKADVASSLNIVIYLVHCGLDQDTDSFYQGIWMGTAEWLLLSKTQLLSLINFWVFRAGLFKARLS